MAPTVTPNTPNKPTVVANGGTKPATTTQTKPEADQMEQKADKPTKEKRERGPNKPMLMDVKKFALVLKDCTTLDQLYEKTGLTRGKEAHDFMKSTYRVLQQKGFKVPTILEFQTVPRIKYDEDALASILGVDPEAKAKADAKAAEKAAKAAASKPAE